MPTSAANCNNTGRTGGRYSHTRKGVMRKSRKLGKRSAKTVQRGGRLTRVNKTSSNTINIPSVAPCRNNASFECYDYPEAKDALYHQAQFFPETVGQDTKDCILHSVNNFLGRSAYNKTTWSQWFAAFHSNIDSINALLVAIEPSLTLLHSERKENGKEYISVFHEDSAHSLKSWPARYAEYKKSNTSIFGTDDDNQPYEIWFDNREYDILLAWWLLSFRLINGKLMFFPMDIHTGLRGHPAYKKCTIEEYIKHRKPQPLKLIMGDFYRGHAYTFIQNGSDLIKLNSTIWRSVPEINRSQRQPNVSNSITRLTTTHFNVIYQLKDKSTDIDPTKATELFDEIMTENSDETAFVAKAAANEEEPWRLFNYNAAEEAEEQEEAEADDETEPPKRSPTNPSTPTPTSATS